MEKETVEQENQIYQNIIELLSPIDKSSQEKIIRLVTTLLELGMQSPKSIIRQSQENVSGTIQRESVFSGHKVLTPKKFMIEKSPQTEMEKAICLAYYLAHYHDMPHFKTVDISKLNTEAAQRKFTNASYAINNAVQSGYFVPAIKGHKQISVMGERYVEALPNREEVKSVLKQIRPRRRRTKANTKKKK